MDGFEVTTERVVSTGVSVGDTAVALAGEIARMDAILGDLRVAWVSTEAAPRFVALMERQLADATALKNTLSGHGEALAVAGRNMADTEAALAGSLTGA